MSFDLHTHTVFSDGKNTAEEMVLSAIEKGLDTIGISDHSYTSFDTEYCMDINRYDEYIRTISDLKEKYKERIQVLCGIEQDLYSEKPSFDFDYIIGSIHYVRVKDAYLAIDLDAGSFEKLIREHFHDDPYALCEAYYSSFASLYERTHCDIVGHFDLIAKFNEEDRYFSESDPRYETLWKDAMDVLLKDIRYFESNFAAFNKGLRSVPYLPEKMRSYLTEHGGIWICSSDSHAKETIGRFA